MGDRIGVQLPVRKIYLSLTNHPGQLSLAIPLWVGTVSTGQRAVMQIWCCLQVTLCDPYLSAIVAFAKTRYTNPRILYFTLLLLLLLLIMMTTMLTCSSWAMHGLSQ